jgi:GNAT superfamily N-acetyltransferase
MPLVDHGDAAQMSGPVPPLDQVFYCAESVLLPAYRGQGIGHAFFDRREAFARDAGFAYSVFCGVIRPDDHPSKPVRYRPLDGFWRKRGYRPLDGAVAQFRWTDLGDDHETAKPLQVWMRTLEEDKR